MLPDDKILLETVAEYVGWTGLHYRGNDELYGNRPNGEGFSGISVPDYLYSVDDWLRDVAPRIEQRGFSQKWLTELEALTGKWVINWVNASARERCFALQTALKSEGFPCD